MSEPGKSEDYEVPDFCRKMDKRLGHFFDQLHEENDSFTPEGSDEGRYAIEDKIAQGGLKDIYRTFDQKSQRYVAMAVPRNSEVKDINEFLREAQITALLEHPNIIPVYDVSEGEEPYFIMKIIHGNNLSDLLFSNSSIASLNQLLRSFVQICNAVEYAHSRGVVHLDLKPENIQIDKYGEVLLHDWGLSRRLFIPDGDNNLLATDKIDSIKILRGTPSYMAPEQFSPDKKTVDERTDIFSLGCILFSILTQKPPFPSTTKISEREFSESIESNSKIPQSLSAVTLKALKIEPDERYQSVTELKLDLERYLDGFATKAEDANFIKQLSLLIQRNKLICGVMIIALVILFSGGALFVSEIQKEKDNTQKALIKSLESQKIAEGALSKAQENFALYVNEKEEKEEVSEISTQSLYRTDILPNRSSYSVALGQLKAALKLSPKNKEVYTKKVLLHLFNGELESAIKDYSKSSQREFLSKAIRIAKNYLPKMNAARELSDSDFINLILDLSNTANNWVAGNMIIAHKMKKKGKDSHIRLIKGISLQINPEQKEWNWDFATEDGVIFSHFSFKGLTDIHTLLGLSGAKISYLDLSHIKNVYLQNLVHTFVNKLNLYGSKIHGVQHLKRINGLEKIIVQKGQISEEDKRMLSFLDIEELD